MTPNLRIYATDQGARAVDTRLKEDGFEQRSLLLASQLSGKEEEAVHEAIRQERLPKRNLMIAIRSLKEGRSLVAVRAPYRRGRQVLEIMETDDAVDSDLLRRYAHADPSPLSDMMRMPPLARFEPMTGLLGSRWSLSGKFGWPLLINAPAPLSSKVGMKVLSEPKKNWTSSFGLSLLSRNAAPLSSLFAMPTLTRSKGPRSTSFGLPLLSKEPATLSKLFGIQTLSKEASDRDKP